MQKLLIEIQHFYNCPNSPILIERVREAIKDQDNVDYREVIVDSNEKAKEIRFRGSPTLLINGEDFENQTEPESPALSCRYYQNGLPSVEKIKSKLSELSKDMPMSK
ncbi:MAG: DUF2703 domain-containing protein [Ignavibacteriaceae bacterium]